MNKQTKRTPLYVGGVIILILVFLAFFGGPFLGLGNQQRSKIVFGRYRNREVAYAAGNYFAVSLGNLSNQFQQSSLPQSDADYVLWRGAFDEALFHEALMYLAETSNMDVSELAVDTAIASSGQFQSADGFDVTQWRSLTQTERLRVRRYTREALIHNRVLGDIQSGILIGAPEIKFIEDAAQQERQIRFVSIGTAQLADIDMERYIAENRSLFVRIRSTRLELSGTLNEAERVRDRLEEDGSNFTRILQEYSVDGGEASDSPAGWYYFYELARQFPSAENVSSLLEVPEGRLSEIISENDQHAIFFVQERLPVEEQNLTALLSDARAYLRNYDTVSLQDYLAEVAGDVAADSQRNNSLTETAKSYKLAIEESSYFSINFANNELFPTVEGESAEILEGAANSEDFFLSIFSLQEQEISQPIAAGNSYIVAQLTGIRTSDPEFYEFFDSFYHSQNERWQGDDARRILLKRDVVFDNFEETYTQLVNNQNTQTP